MNDDRPAAAGALWAVMDPASPAWRRWVRATGIDALPVISGRKVEATIRGRVRSFYLADLGLVEADQLRRIEAERARELGIPLARVRRTLRAWNRLAILADETRICEDPDEGRAYFTDRRMP